MPLMAQYRLSKSFSLRLSHKIIFKRLYSTHYEVLNVPKSANPAEIKQAYFALCKQFHPDLNPSPSASIKFREISSAYEVLSNQVKRQEYDLSLKYSRYPQSFDSLEYWQSRQPRQSPFSDQQNQQSYDPRQGWGNFRNTNYKDPHNAKGPDYQDFYGHYGPRPPGQNYYGNFASPRRSPLHRRRNRLSGLQVIIFVIITQIFLANLISGPSQTNRYGVDLSQIHPEYDDPKPKPVK